MTGDYQPVEDDPEAPTSRAEPPPPPPPRATTRTTRRPAAGGASTRPRGRPKGSKTKAPPPQEVGAAEAVRGLLQIPATAVIMVGQRVGSVPLVADGATVIVHGPAFAAAVEEVAKHDPRVMAMLEKLVAFGPYGMFVTACVIMGAQFGRNHAQEENAMVLEAFGAVSPDKIIEMAGLDVPASPSGNGQRNPANVGSPEV